MPLPRFAQPKPFATLGMIVLAWLLVPAGLKMLARASFFELTAPITVAVSHARDLQSYWALRTHSKNELIEAGRDLARVNASYELAVQQNSELHAEIARLESLLHLPSFSEHRYEPARVARRDFSAWWQQIVIRKGRNFGITINAPVVFSGGVVGIVREVHATTSVVELITSPNLRIAGVVEGDSRPVSFQGRVNPTFAPSKGRVEFVPLDVFANARSPRRLVTSGLGGVFPPGLTLGTIDKLQLGSDGLFQSGDVKLDDRLGSLTEVTVLVPLSSD